MEHPRPPGSLDEQPSNAYVIERLKRQLRGDGSQDWSREELKRIVREQLPDSQSDDDYIEKILDELGDGRLSRELFVTVQDIAK